MVSLNFTTYALHKTANLGSFWMLQCCIPRFSSCVTVACIVVHTDAFVLPQQLLSPFQRQFWRCWFSLCTRLEVTASLVSVSSQTAASSHLSSFYLPGMFVVVVIFWYQACFIGEVRYEADCDSRGSLQLPWILPGDRKCLPWFLFARIRCLIVHVVRLAIFS